MTVADKIKKTSLAAQAKIAAEAKRQARAEEKKKEEERKAVLREVPAYYKRLLESIESAAADGKIQYFDPWYKSVKDLYFIDVLILAHVLGIALLRVAFLLGGLVVGVGTQRLICSESHWHFTVEEPSHRSPRNANAKFGLFVRIASAATIHPPAMINFIRVEAVLFETFDEGIIAVALELYGEFFLDKFCKDRGIEPNVELRKRVDELTAEWRTRSARATGAIE